MIKQILLGIQCFSHKTNVKTYRFEFYVEILGLTYGFSMYFECGVGLIIQKNELTISLLKTVLIL
jgi:hypothetical protein